MTGQEAAGTSTLIKHANDLLHATDSSLLVKYGFWLAWSYHFSHALIYSKVALIFMLCGWSLRNIFFFLTMDIHILPKKCILPCILLTYHTCIFMFQELTVWYEKLSLTIQAILLSEVCFSQREQNICCLCNVATERFSQENVILLLIEAWRLIAQLYMTVNFFLVLVLYEYKLFLGLHYINMDVIFDNLKLFNYFNTPSIHATCLVDMEFKELVSFTWNFFSQKKINGIGFLRLMERGIPYLSC